MNNNIKKSDNNSPDKLSNEISLNGFEIKSGDLVMNTDGNIFIIEITPENKVRKYYYVDGVKGSFYGESSMTEMNSYRYIKVEKLDEIEKEVDDILSGKKQLEEPTKPDLNEQSTDIIPTNGKATLVAMENNLRDKINRYESVSRAVKNKLEMIRNKMNSILETHRYQLEKVQNAITTIELYLGIHEEIIQLQEGVNSDMPLYIRQQILYMDEEVGITDNQGIDYSNIETFDRWLISPENLNRLIPEEKCIVVFRVRRHDKEYFDRFDNALKNQENLCTYFLLKNGTNVYRIWGDLIIHPRVFPNKNEMNKLYEETEKSTWKERDIKKFEQTLNRYKKHLLVLQGLIDRTEIFKPIKQGINIFNPETFTDEDIRLIYDDDFLLPSGRKSFREWKKEINSSIDRGSRIIWIKTWQNSSSSKESYWQERFERYYKYSPGSPDTGVYTIEERLEKSRFGYEFKFLFFPSHSWSERKNKLGWLCGSDESEVLNYDKISLEDIEFYLNSRVDRPNYLDMLPILKYLRKKRLEEIEWEKYFVKMVVGEVMKASTESEENIEKIVWEAIDWWKYKVIWKRPITEDDEKALRMIKSRVFNSIKK